MPRGMGEVSPSNIAHFLKGIDFPATKQDMIDYADDNNAPEEIIDIIDNLPDVEFQSMTEVMTGVSELV